MKINSIKDLKAVIRLCRQQGVASVKIDGVELLLGPAPVKTRRNQDVVSEIPEANISVPRFNPHTGSSQDFTQGEIDTPDELSEEQLMFYSAQGHTEQ